MNKKNQIKKHNNLHGLYVPFDPNYSYANYKTDNATYQSDKDSGPHEAFGGVEMDFFIRSKEETILSRINLLSDEIKFRYDLQNSNIYQINCDQCTCKSLIYTMGENIFDNKRIELERKILDLEQEKRREKGNSFKDITFLNKELRDSLIEKLEEKQKAALVLDQGEEIPCNI